MAKGLTYKKQIVESISVKGILNEDGTKITYIDEEKVEQTIPVASLMEKFCSMPIEFGIKLKTEEDLDLDTEDNYVDIDTLSPDYDEDVSLEEQLAYTD